MYIISIIIYIRLFPHYGNTTYADRVSLRGSRVTRTVHLFRIITKTVHRLYYYPCTECLQNTSKRELWDPVLRFRNRFCRIVAQRDRGRYEVFHWVAASSSRRAGSLVHTEKETRDRI